MDEILRDTENMLARGRMDLPLSLCFAATRGDASLLHRLLTRGSDPNEADATGRTAMVGTNFLSLFLKLYKCFTKTCHSILSYLSLFSFIEQHIAASNGNQQCVAILLEYGANPNVKGMVS